LWCDRTTPTTVIFAVRYFSNRGAYIKSLKWGCDRILGEQQRPLYIHRGRQICIPLLKSSGHLEPGFARRDFLACAFPVISFFYECLTWLSFSMYGNLLPKSFRSKRMVDNGKLQSVENEKGNVPQHGKISPMCPLDLPCRGSS